MTRDREPQPWMQRGGWQRAAAPLSVPASGRSAAHSACQREDALGLGGIHKPKLNPRAKASGTELSGTDLERENQRKFTSWLTASCQDRGPERYFSFREGESQETLFGQEKEENSTVGWRAILRDISLLAELVLPPLLLQALRGHPPKPQGGHFSELHRPNLTQIPRNNSLNLPRAREDKGFFICSLPTARQAHGAWRLTAHIQGHRPAMETYGIF